MFEVVLGGCRGGIKDRARGHVAADNLGAIEVNHRSVVSQEFEQQSIAPVDGIQGEVAPEIDGVVRLGTGATLIDRGCLVIIPVAKFCRTGFPLAVIIVERGPLHIIQLCAVVQVFPHRIP